MLAVEPLGDALRRRGELLRVAEPARLAVERLLLAGHDLRPVDLLHHVAQVVGAPAHLFPPRRERPLLGLHRAELADRLRHRAHVGLRLAERVEEGPLGLGAEQRLGLVLAVEVHEEGAELGEHAGGGGASVDPGPRAAFGRHLAPDDEAALVEVEPQGLDRRALAGGKILEHALDQRPRPARADLPAVGAAAEEEAERVHQHRLPRPGLAGQHVEPGPEGEGDVRDGGEVADPELRDHGGDSRSVRSPQRRLARIRAK